MPKALPCVLMTWKQVYRRCRELARQLRYADFKIDCIVAIARGGYVPGRILSDLLGVHDLTGFKIEHYRNTEKQPQAFVKYPLNADLNGRNVLLIDDVCDSGDTFATGTDHVRQCGSVGELRTAALHFKTVAQFIPDYYAEAVNDWRWIIYPWAVTEDLSVLIANLQPLNTGTKQLQRFVE